MKRKYLVLLHITVWLLLVSNDIWNSVSYRFFLHDRKAPITAKLFGEYTLTDLFYLLIPIVCFYSAYLLIAPALLSKKNLYKAFIYAVLTFVAACGWRYLLEYHIMIPWFGFDNYGGHPWPVGDYILNVFFYYFPRYMVYGLMYFFVESWYKTRLRQQELQKEKTAAELSFLRSQVNPHFLFNSINDIYALALQKSEQAPEALLKLSDILRYMLREDNGGTIALTEEMAYIHTVIDLQRISAKGGAYVEFRVEGPVENCEVPSLIFIPFVENAFKHGVLNDVSRPIVIKLEVAGNFIRFNVFNQKNHHLKDNTGGIGLGNIRRRLDLLYPGKHELAINESDENYAVKLTLHR